MSDFSSFSLSPHLVIKYTKAHSREVKFFHAKSVGTQNHRDSENTENT